MKKFLFFALIHFSLCLSQATTSFALPLLYSAAGAIHDKQQQALPISGWVLFDDQLRDWNTGAPVTLHNYLGISNYRYAITDYQLSVGGNTFSGKQGSLYMPLGQAIFNQWDTGDLMWFLEGAAATWSQWTGEHFFFFNADGTAKDPSQYCNLADLIQLCAFDYMFNDPILPSYDPSFNLWLTRQAVAPIPEPSTLVLFGASLLGLLALRRKS